MGKVNRELAEQMVDKWLDYKRVKPAKRESYKASIENITDAVEEGSLILNEETHELEYTLDIPIGESKIQVLKFRPRLTVGEINKRLKGVSPKEADARVVAYVSALTGQNSGVIEMLDTNDYDVCQAISVFFM
jgi:type I site-specific restriction endonuclease